MYNEDDISVIICAYTLDRWQDLVEALESIREQTVQPAEVVLVIDHNPSLYEKAQAAFPWVKVVENQEERGLSGARNTGIAHSAGKIIAFMDEDGVAASDWIATLLRGYDDRGVMGVGGEVKPMWAVNPPDWFPEEFNWVVGCSYKGLPESPAPVRNPIGCNMSFRKSVMQEAGGFRNGIGRVGTVPVGCEETELTIRARQLNPDSIYLYHPDAVVYHKVPEWRLKWSYFVRRCYAEGLSKAQVTHFVGSGDGLESERRYTMRTLPMGVLTGVAGLRRGRFAGVKRAAAIIIGLGVTTLGYLAGKAARRGANSPAMSTPIEATPQTREL